jgi:hypothetical protein
VLFLFFVLFFVLFCVLAFRNIEKTEVLGTPVSSTNKSDRHDLTEILLKVTLNTINKTDKHIHSHKKRYLEVISRLIRFKEFNRL